MEMRWSDFGFISWERAGNAKRRKMQKKVIKSPIICGATEPSSNKKRVRFGCEFQDTVRGFMALLFDGDGFCEVARLVHVAAATDSDVIGEKLQWDDLEDRSEKFWSGMNLNHVVRGFPRQAVAL